MSYLPAKAFKTLTDGVTASFYCNGPVKPKLVCSECRWPFLLMLCGLEKIMLTEIGD